MYIINASVGKPSSCLSISHRSSTTVSFKTIPMLGKKRIVVHANIVGSEMKRDGFSFDKTRYGLVV